MFGVFLERIFQFSILEAADVRFDRDISFVLEVVMVYHFTKKVMRELYISK